MVNWETEADASVGEAIHAADGLWTNPSRETNRRVSAVLFTDKLSLFALQGTEVRLYLNPWATSPLPECSLMKLPRAVVVDDRLTYLDGEPIGKLLGLPDRWPFAE